MFSADYFIARDRFRCAAGAASSAYDLAATGPNGEKLSIDIAWIGDPAARRLLFVTSGIHGVEGFAGSALQCAFLAAKIEPLPDCAVALVHALNPWGFAHLRRVNEHNVDLNRNFLVAPGAYSGAPPEYRVLNRFLNPPSPPAADAFHLRAGYHAARHGLHALRKAIATGQYEHARGLFFGGNCLEQSSAILLRWLSERCAGVKQMLALDLHTGLGRFAAINLLATRNTAAERVAALSDALAMPIAQGGAVERSGAYFARGAMLDALPETLPHARIDALTAEFGTYGGLRMLHALREENRWHHYGSGEQDHPAKRRLAATFNPDSAHWRDAVLAQGTQLLSRALAALY